VGLLTKLWGKKPEVSNQPSEPLSESCIQEWLVTRIAAIAQVMPEEIAMDRPFAEFCMGLSDNREVVALFEFARVASFRWRRTGP
jgi:hypothetical protein